MASQKRYHWWNSPGFRDDDGSIYWKGIQRHLRSRAYVNWWRVQNRFRDARAVLAGACNRDTWTGKGFTGYAGGYSHWRCGREGGHDGEHRFHNYVWSGHPEDRVIYAPIEFENEGAGATAIRRWTEARAIALPYARLTSKRRAVVSRRRGRELARLHEAIRVKPRVIADPFKEDV